MLNKKKKEEEEEEEEGTTYYICNYIPARKKMAHQVCFAIGGAGFLEGCNFAWTYVCMYVK